MAFDVGIGLKNIKIVIYSPTVGTIFSPIGFSAGHVFTDYFHGVVIVNHIGFDLGSLRTVLSP
ncbi:hypothetical protein A3I51_03350 [Candidatus Gottesmanbacteria bacterium RIFCSPLOWO2_02_FULL_38_8]|uniref:Uncharacterized protein n=1 Tax=Candidatus Gottesmanbacteria bacterium RIFCSPLOWO2_02_FULL_38_8 TaxID=1798397 RepID=A0A1F6B3D7_9BACT|nr:MAG: hypothetical protein A3I51_03350 [Candidatus Gottesmanbacteria bacterium RIFCSPLOWO2_02_FULL_38_8]